MNQPRRTFLASLGVIGVQHSFLPNFVHPIQDGATPFVLPPGEGEHLVHFRDQGSIVIAIGERNGSRALAIGTQQVKVGTGIPTHRHSMMDEAFIVLEGSGAVMLDDVRHPIARGSTVFIPKKTWHGFENPERELLLQWTVTPAGLDAFFRETCSPVGAPPKSLTRDQIRAIARKHDTEFR